MKIYCLRLLTLGFSCALLIGWSTDGYAAKRVGGTVCVMQAMPAHADNPVCGPGYGSLSANNMAQAQYIDVREDGTAVLAVSRDGDTETLRRYFGSGVFRFEYDAYLRPEVAQAVGIGNRWPAFVPKGDYAITTDGHYYYVKVPLVREAR
ncbi:MAG: hypothetical protein U0T84_02125 [Chitinophagales bacterium]